MSETIEIPVGWLLGTLKLLSTLAGEGLFMDGCEDPESLMVEVSEHLGVSDADDPWEASILKLTGLRAQP